MNLSPARIAKGVAGILLLVVLFSVVTRWYGEYRQIVGAAGETTVTAPPAGEGATSPTPVPSNAKTVVVLTEGLNFRDEASREGNKIRGLKKGERLVLIKTNGGWYQVQDKTGTRGWISASKSYSKVVD